MGCVWAEGHHLSARGGLSHPEHTTVGGVPECQGACLETGDPAEASEGNRWTARSAFDSRRLRR